MDETVDQQPASDVFGFSYRVEKSEIVVRNRPRHLCISLPKTHANSELETADAYLSVTDSFVVAPAGKILLWFPWNEGRKPTPEMYYATNRAIYWWVFRQEIPHIQIFCDGGTHRSVTVFGAFLRTYFPAQAAAEIVAERKCLYVGPDKHLIESAANPLAYIDSYLEEFPVDRLLFKAMQADPLLGRLEGLSRQIYRDVGERYADQK